MPPGSFNSHHWIPKSRGGDDVSNIHIVCHDKIHHTFSEYELETYYNSPSRVLEHPEMIKFVRWISKQSPDSYFKHRDSKERNKKR